MSTPILDQNRAYRKGLILGFTMAEISILIIFCLLLATSFLIQKKNHKIDELNDQSNQVKVILEKLQKKSIAHIEIDDLFQKLVRAEAQAEKINKLQNELDKRLTEVKEFKAVKKALQNTATDKPIKKIISELISNAQYAKEIKDSLNNPSSKNYSAKEIAQVINSSGNLTEVVTEKTNALAEIERLKEQLTDAHTKLDHLGKGADWPSCWRDPVTRKTEFIFEIDLTSSGLVIHDRHLTNRINDQKLLPISMIEFDKNLTQRDFLAETLPLFQWSRQHNCHFFVIAKDKTPDQKHVYKSMLRSLDSHFYKRLDE